MRAALGAKQAERDRAAAELEEHKAVPIIAPHPQIAEAYRKRIRSLALTLNKGEVSSNSSAG